MLADPASSSILWIGLGYFGTGIISAILPWVNSELLVASIPAVAMSRTVATNLMLMVTAGHMTGKTFIYWTSRAGSRILQPRIERAVSRWSEKLRTRPRRAVLLLLVASTVGLPPFYVMTLVAGALRVNFVIFIVTGTVGQLIRFSAVLMLSGSVIDAVRALIG
jgi:membrane protein YqaA with SNARE-associated domain